MEREWGRRRRREREEADALERAISKRRWIYEHDLYAKHVASNPYTRYRPHPTPAQFSASADLQSRAAIFVRRELRVWPSLDVEFLTTFILSLMKSIDIRSESAIKLLAEFLDMDQPYVQGGRYKNAEHFAHEVYSYLRSPYRDLSVYDSVVQYDTPEDIPQPPHEDPPRSSRWRPSVSRSPSPQPGPFTRRESRRGQSEYVSESPHDGSASRSSAGRKRSYGERSSDVVNQSTGRARRNRDVQRGRPSENPTRSDTPQPRPQDRKEDHGTQSINRDDVVMVGAVAGRDKGKAKANTVDIIDITESDKEGDLRYNSTVEAAAPANGTALRGGPEAAADTPASSTLPSHPAVTGTQSTDQPSGTEDHGVSGSPARIDGGPNPPRRVRPRLNLRDSVHAHLNGRTRRPGDAAQIQSADLAELPSMGTSSAQGRLAAAAPSLLARITESKSSSSSGNIQADKAPGKADNDQGAGQVQEEARSVASGKVDGSDPLQEFVNPSTSASPRDVASLRQRLQEKLEEEKRRHQPGHEVGKSELVAATRASSESGDIGNVDTLAAEGKLRMQARLRARLAMAKKGMAEGQC
ncbi:hypothetical protein GLOTRDRAFT_131270 [Gloeophyllum trabeum ATCC 11539]|uniref:RING-type E3 ubiquitin transferase n=1 Tax=Gloeophyllum trabeum (strain ATCC 11539 / FP-39264 / Madison 617) TaxID=670483 RepID=S7Q1J9_GLOTA|nr:uncharacterized protein GLOTRDRAFT_131270 [Gloeophyllum trabeum ATCC 11539]EPQ53397.1 hypothetical protein GLOTRDRAFT_131270 [Gloeophyllum trabeum ATCC 11539]